MSDYELKGLEGLKQRLNREKPRLFETRVFDIQIEDLTLEVRVSYCPPEQSTYDYPGSPSEISINSVWLDDKDITCLLDFNNLEEVVMNIVEKELEE